MIFDWFINLHLHFIDVKKCFALQYLQIGAGLLVTFLNAGLWIKQRTFVIAFWSFCCSVMTLESLLKCDIISHKLKTNATKLFPHHLGIWGNCPAPWTKLPPPQPPLLSVVCLTRRSMIMMGKVIYWKVQTWDIDSYLKTWYFNIIISS